jgi:hypothetical protein
MSDRPGARRSSARPGWLSGRAVRRQRRSTPSRSTCDSTRPACRGGSVAQTPRRGRRDDHKNRLQVGLYRRRRPSRTSARRAASRHDVVPSAGEDLLGTRVSRKAGEARSHRQGWRGSTQISRRRPAGTARAPCAKCYAGCRAPQAGGAQAVLVSAGGVRPREPAAPDSVATSTAASSGRRMAGHSGSARINGGHRGAADGCVPFGVPQRPQTRGQSQSAAES